MKWKIKNENFLSILNFLVVCVFGLFSSRYDRTFEIATAMDILFLSKRMFIDNAFVNGGILVTPEGKIRSVLRSQQEVNSWMYANEADEVC